MLHKVSTSFLGHVSLLFRWFLPLAFMGTLLAASLVGMVRGDSHAITDEYINVEPDGYWTAEVAAGEHQVWSFDLGESRDHNMV